jgi:hypothetical protein
MLALVAHAGVLSAQATWKVDSIPVLDIRGTATSGEAAFGLATGATRLSNGTIAIADASTLSIRFFSPTGQHVRTVGRAGAGPGELRSLVWLGSCGADSVYAWDMAQRRMSVIGASSTDIVRQFRVPADENVRATPLNIGCTSQRTFVYVSLPTSREPTATENVIRGRTPVTIVDADGKIIRQIADITAGEVGVMGGAGFPRPLGRSTSVAAIGDRVFIGTADSAAIDEISADGSTRTVRLTIAERPVTPAHIDRAIEAIASIAPPQARERATASMRQIEMPKSLPPYSRLLGDPDGLVWVVLSIPGDPTTSLRAIRPGAGVVADVTIPRGITVTEIGRDYVLGMYEAADAEQHVVMYRLRRQ